MRPAVLLPLTAAALLTAAPALADDLSTHLEYNTGPGTESCPKERGFRHIVAAHIRYDPFVDGAARRLTVRITRKDQAYNGAIALYDETGKKLGIRNLDAFSTCGSLVHTLAESIALILDPPPKPPTPPPAPAPTTAPDAAPEPPKLTAEPPAPEPPALAAQPPAPDLPSPPPPTPSIGPRPQIGAGILLPIGAAPGLALGFGAGFGYRWHFASLNIEARAHLPRNMDEPVNGARVAASMFAGALVPCAHFRWMLGCGIVSAGAVHFTADDMVSDQQWGPRFELGARLGVQIPLYGRFSAQLSSDFLFPIVRAGIVIRGDQAWDPPLVSALPALRFVAVL